MGRLLPSGIEALKRKRTDSDPSLSSLKYSVKVEVILISCSPREGILEDQPQDLTPKRKNIEGPRRGVNPHPTLSRQ